ncbi:MAG: hypothetical protein ACMVO5_04550 [Polymorphobacter sp.]|uniref:hypothetical protein n=1 Tax=Polymorphobacter sp. TaxID=1909290 RepID=UPI003A8B2606
MTAEPVERLAAAASEAGQQLGQTLTDLRQRTQPEALLDEVLDIASEKGQQLVRKTRETATAHPLAMGAAVAAIGLALLTRNTLSNARVDLGDDSTDYTDYDDSYEPAPPLPDTADINPSGFTSVVLGLALGALIAVFTAKN